MKSLHQTLKHKSKGSHSQVGHRKWLQELEPYYDISNITLAVVLEQTNEKKKETISHGKLVHDQHKGAFSIWWIWTRTEKEMHGRSNGTGEQWGLLRRGKVHLTGNLSIWVWMTGGLEVAIWKHRSSAIFLLCFFKMSKLNIVLTLLSS